jgi:hypothetical protein
MYSSFFLVLFISVCVISMAIGILVLQYNSKALVNKIFFALIVAVNIWSIGLAFGMIAPDIISCLSWRRFASFGWGTAYAIILHFILVVTGALDYKTGKSVLKLLHDTCKSMGKTVIVVTHNSAITRMADKVIHLRNGTVHKIEININPLPVERIEW